ncbi:YhgE/Pip domain-containing protein [Caryophanon latum]|nr:ABC transporter permease [Caryophanon latum]
MGIFYAVAMLVIFLIGYTALPGQMDELHIAIVNDDNGSNGEKIAEQLEESLPFHIELGDTYEQALQKLKDNDVSLLIHIPSHFSRNIMSGESAEINFTVNEASATMVSSSMSSIVNEVNAQLSASFSTQTAQSILMKMNVPKEQAAELSQKIENAYVGNYVIVNDVPDGMHHTMLPMFLVMAAYVGAMIAAMQLVQVYQHNRGEASRFRLFTYVQLSALLIAVVSTIFALITAYWITDLSTDVMLQVAAQQVLVYMASFNVCAIFTFLVGEAGMILNIPILLTQTIANGATMPREMMYGYYEFMSYITPMYHAVNGYFATMYGSTDAAPFILGLAAVGVGALLINLLVVTTLHKKAPKPRSVLK